jgi:hypothetical protein
MFRHLGVSVHDGQVRSPLGKTCIGPLEGARVEVTASDGIHFGAGIVGAALLGPVGLVAGQQAFAYIVFADGTHHKQRLVGAAAIGKAKQEAVEFGLLEAESSA